MSYQIKGLIFTVCGRQVLKEKEFTDPLISEEGATERLLEEGSPPELLWTKSGLGKDLRA